MAVMSERPERGRGQQRVPLAQRLAVSHCGRRTAERAPRTRVQRALYDHDQLPATAAAATTVGC